MKHRNVFNPINESWHSISEAAHYLSVSEPTLYRWMKEGRITYFKVGDSTRFRKVDLDLMFQKHGGQKDPQSLQEQCPLCGSWSVEPGSIASTGRIYFKADRTGFFTFRTSEATLKAGVCMDCGNVQLYADIGKIAKLVKHPSP